MAAGIFMLAGVGEETGGSPLRCPMRRPARVAVHPGYNPTRLPGFPASRVGRDYAFRVAPRMPDTVRAPQYVALGGASARAGLGVSLPGVYIENRSLAGAIGASLASLRSQIDGSQAYTANPALRTEALRALDSLNTRFRPLKGRVDADDYDWAFTNSAADVNNRLKTLQSEIDAFVGQISRFLKGWQSSVATTSAVKTTRTAAEREEEERKKTWWEQYKTPVYVGAGALGLVTAAYLFGPLIRGLGSRVAAPRPPPA